jgi:hypothetical protein
MQARRKLLPSVPASRTARRSYEPRIGYFHRETSRFVATDLDGYIRTHHRTDEAEVADQIDSTYQD